jgi:hypothetical protein
MSKGAGSVEMAIRTLIASEFRAYRHLSEYSFSSDDLCRAAFGEGPWTRAQRVSAKRAMHRITDRQPG